MYRNNQDSKIVTTKICWEIGCLLINLSLKIDLSSPSSIKKLWYNDHIESHKWNAKNTNVEKMNSKHGIQYTSNTPVYSFKIRWTQSYNTVIKVKFYTNFV